MSSPRPLRTTTLPCALPLPGEPLSPEHLRIPHDGRILLADVSVQEEIAEADPDRPLDFSCGHCPERFPHSAPLARHVARNHGPESDQAAVPLDLEQEPEPERALTSA